MNQRRRQQLQDTLERILNVLKTQCQPDQGIVFSSLASGNVTATSDLDLLMVKETNKGFFERIKEVVALCDYDIGVDILVYTREELTEAARINLFVRDEILSYQRVQKIENPELARTSEIHIHGRLLSVPYGPRCGGRRGLMDAT